MSSYAQVMAIVEGPTEKLFIEGILAPHLATKKVFITPMLLTKPGQNGGDVKFSRAKKDIEKHLKQRHDTYVTLVIDYYGTRRDWPGIALSEEDDRLLNPAQKAQRVNAATMEKVVELYHEFAAHRRFIPYISMHEFEALLFSSPSVLAAKLDVNQSAVDSILTECGSPEDIINSPLTAPSKRLDAISRRFKKTTTGISVARAIGLPTIRSQCPLFDAWVSTLEGLASATPT